MNDVTQAKDGNATDQEPEERTPEQQLEAIRVDLKWLKEHEIEKRAELEDMRALEKQAREAELKSEKALRAHEAIILADTIQQAMSPSGIPAEILAGAIDPVNERMADLCRIAGWSPVTLTADMELTQDGRHIRQLGVSGAWRANTLLACVIAEMSGLGIVVIDGFDCLAPKHRAAFIMRFLPALNLETVIATATLKNDPTKGVGGTANVVWLGDE